MDLGSCLRKRKLDGVKFVRLPLDAETAVVGDAATSKGKEVVAAADPEVTVALKPAPEARVQEKGATKVVTKKRGGSGVPPPSKKKKLSAKQVAEQNLENFMSAPSTAEADKEAEEESPLVRKSSKSGTSASTGSGTTVYQLLDESSEDRTPPISPTQSTPQKTPLQSRPPTPHFEIANMGSILKVGPSQSAGQREFLRHALPAAVMEEAKKLHARDAYRAMTQNAILNLVTVQAGLEKIEATEAALGTASRAANANEAEANTLRGKLQKIEAELALANEAKTKAEATFLELEAARAKIAELTGKEQQLAERCSEMDNKLAAAQTEIDAQQVAWVQLLKDSQLLEQDKKDLKEDFRRLRAGIPGIVKAALGSPAVHTAFSNFVTAIQEVEVFETVQLFTETIPELPNPLPEAIASKVVPDCHDKVEAANEGLKAISIPFVNRIGGEDDLTIDEILGMKAED